MDERRIAALELLERVRRHEIESETQELGQLRAEAGLLERAKQELETSMDEGAQCADPALRGYLGNFVRSVRSEIDRNQKSRDAIEAKASKIADRVAESFREIKSYEILRLDALAQRAKERAAKEEAELSELAQIRWWREQARRR